LYLDAAKQIIIIECIKYLFIICQVPYDWDNVRVTLERLAPVDANSICAEYETNYNAGDVRSILLSQGET